MDSTVHNIPEPILVFRDNNDTIPYSRVVVPSSMRSPLWRYFGFPANDNNVILNRKRIICCICRTQIAYNKNTTNLSTHLHCKHPSVYAEFAPKKLKPENTDEEEPTSKRARTDEEINVDWFVDENTQLEKNAHPTGIRAKETIKTINGTLNVFDDGSPKSTGIKKSMTLDENFELVITAQTTDTSTDFIETLDYNSKDYMELVNENCDEIMVEAEQLAEEPDDGGTGKSGYLARDFFESFTENTSNGTFEPPIVNKAPAKSHALKVETIDVRQSPRSNQTEKRRPMKAVANVTDITGHLKKFLVTDVVPPSILDGLGFKELIQSLVSNVHIPTSATVEESLIGDYKQQQAETMEFIKSMTVGRHFSLSFNQLKPNALYEIDVNYLPGDHTRYETLETRIIAISQDISGFFDSFEINFNRCSAFVVNFKSNDDAIDVITTFANENGEIPLIQTFSSIINDAVVECMKNVAVDKALEAVLLKEKCAGLCWLEQFELLENTLNASDGVGEFMSTVEIFIRCLRPLKNCLDVLALESLTFASLMKPIALELLNQHYKPLDEGASTDANPLELEMKQTIFNILQKKIIENKFLAMASFLDPRFQGLSLPDDLTQIREYIEKSLNNADAANSKQRTGIKTETKPERTSTGLSSLFASIASGSKSKMPRNRFDMEFRSYTEDVNLDMDQCPLTWWSESEFLYPNIKRYVDKYFCVPAFANASHRLSTEETNRLSRQCDSVTTDTDRMILWLHLNRTRSIAVDERSLS